MTHRPRETRNQTLRQVTCRAVAIAAGCAFVSMLPVSTGCSALTASDDGPACSRKLFDGRSLNGWHVHGEPNVWRVEDGQIIGQLVKKSPYAYLVTDDTFSDFELDLQMRFDSESGNSGVFFRCIFPPQCAKCGHVARKLAEDPQAFRCPECGHDVAIPYLQRVHIHGPQAEFAPQNTGGLYDSGSGGWLNKEKLTQEVQQLHRLGEWNNMRIRAVGNHVTVDLNGQRVSDITDHPFASSGHIGLQLHAGDAMQVRFKNIILRPACAGQCKEK